MNYGNLFRARITLGCVLVFSTFAAASSASAASYAYDGTWNLSFATRSGDCDPSYNFTVNIARGFISHPNLVKFQGKVATNGAARASVQVGEKYASGSGKLSNSTGGGRWVGHSGTGRCSGYWTAQRN